MRIRPCIEKLSDMKPLNHNNDHYCGSCQKTIIDLTDKSDTEIYKLYQAHDNNLCGIVKPKQLQESKFYHPLKRFAFALMLVFGSSLFIFSSCIEIDTNAITNQFLASSSNFDVVHSLKGFVFSDGSPLENALITATVDGIAYTAISNSKGAFLLELPAISSNHVNLRFTATDYFDSAKEVDLSGGTMFVGKTSLHPNNGLEMMPGEIAPMPISIPETIAGAIEPEQEPISRDSIVKCNSETPVKMGKIALPHTPQHQLKGKIAPQHKTSEFE